MSNKTRGGYWTWYDLRTRRFHRDAPITETKKECSDARNRVVGRSRAPWAKVFRQSVHVVKVMPDGSSPDVEAILKYVTDRQ